MGSSCVEVDAIDRYVHAAHRSLLPRAVVVCSVDAGRAETRTIAVAPVQIDGTRVPRTICARYCPDVPRPLHRACWLAWPHAAKPRRGVRPGERDPLAHPSRRAPPWPAPRLRHGDSRRGVGLRWWRGRRGRRGRLTEGDAAASTTVGTNSCSCAPDCRVMDTGRLLNMTMFFVGRPRKLPRHKTGRCPILTSFPRPPSPNSLR